MLLIQIMLFIQKPTSAQDKLINVKGKVINRQEQTIPTVTVKEAEGKQLTVTDLNGRFVLRQLPAGTKILFSCIGYKSEEVLVSRDTIMEIMLTDADDYTLEEVEITTGYEMVPKERATGSFVSVNKELFEQQVSTDVLSRLEAVANSVSVDRNTGRGLTIRGLSTLHGPSSPLIILDNFPYDGDLDNINPNDVENITILKDAAAASIWGARAGNGVIVITTKKANFGSPLRIEANINSTVQERPNLYYRQQISAADFIQVERMLYDNNFYNSWLNASQPRMISPVVELLEQQRIGSISSDDLEGRIAELRVLDVRDDVMKYLYRPALNQQYALNFQGGSDRMAWNLSAAYDSNADEVNAKYNRLNLRYYANYQLLESLQLSGDLNFTQSESQSGRDADAVPYNFFPYAKLIDEQGSSLPIPRGYRMAVLDTLGGGDLQDWHYYPLEDYKHIDNRSLRYNIQANVGANYKLAKGIALDLKYRLEREILNQHNMLRLGAFGARDIINRYAEYDEHTGAYRSPIPIGGLLDEANNRLQSYNLRGQFNINKLWSNAHELTAIAGGEIREVGLTGATQRYHGYNEVNLTYGEVDYLRQYRNFFTGAQQTLTNFNDLRKTTNRFISLYTNAAYTYLSRYTVSISGRRDASNLFGINVNDGWNPLWSAGIAWNITEESFLKLPMFSFLKLRASYGKSGNVDPSQTALTTIQYARISPYTQTTFAQFNRYFNPNLQWETSAVVNIGIDMSLKRDRLQGSIEYFSKTGRNLFDNVAVDYTGGVGGMIYQNAGSMKARGVDIEIRSQNIVSGRFMWSSHLNWSYYHDEIIQSQPNTSLVSNFVANPVAVSGIKGTPVHAIYSYYSPGLHPQTGDPVGYLNGEWSVDYRALTSANLPLEALKVNGPAMPRFFGSLGNTFSYKDFSLTARVMFKLGHYFNRNSINYNQLYSNWQGHADIADRWMAPGDEQYTDIPSMVYPVPLNRDAFYLGSETLVERADHIRLQYVNLGYTIRFPEQSRLKKLQVYLNANNLGLLWRANNRGIDPDHYQYASVPPSRNLALGLRANF